MPHLPFPRLKRSANRGVGVGGPVAIQCTKEPQGLTPESKAREVLGPGQPPRPWEARLAPDPGPRGHPCPVQAWEAAARDRHKHPVLRVAQATFPFPGLETRWWAMRHRASRPYYPGHGSPGLASRPLRSPSKRGGAGRRGEARGGEEKRGEARGGLPRPLQDARSSEEKEEQREEEKKEGQEEGKRGARRGGDRARREEQRNAGCKWRQRQWPWQRGPRAGTLETSK